MSEDDLTLNITTPVGQKLRATYDEDAKAYVLHIKADGDEGIFVTEDIAHEEIHEGHHYAYVNAQDVGGSSTISFLMVVPDTVYVPHFLFSLQGESEFDLQIFEGATPQANGTLVTNPGIFNRNRNKPDNNGMKIYSSPTLGAGSKGTLLERFHTGSGRQIGGEARGNSEIVLRRNTKYWADLANLSATANFLSWVVDWYERETG